MSSEFHKLVEALLNDGAELLKTGDFARAREIFDEAMRINPGNPAALHMAAIVASMQGRLLEAITLLNGSLLARPDDAKAWANLARMALSSGNLVGAEVAASIACRIDASYGAARQIQVQIQSHLEAVGMTLEQYVRRVPSATPEAQYVWIGIHMATPLMATQIPPSMATSNSPT